ncbi:MAG: DUF4139 domain-containing protein [Desulfovibrionaceae bacterium]
MKRFRFAGLSAGLLAAVLLVLSTQTVSALEPENGPNITVYSTGQALVTEVRSMDLPASGEIAFTGTPETLDPSSVTVRSLTAPDKLRVRGVRLLPSAADPHTVLRNYLGREVEAVLPDPSGGDGRVKRRGILLSAGSQAVLRMGNELYVGPLEAVLLPVDDLGPRAEPALLLDVVRSGKARHNVEVSYLAGGLSWTGDSALVLDPSGLQGEMSCWATLNNGSGHAYDSARLRLLTGEVNRVNPQPAPMMYKAEARSLGAGAPVVMDAEVSGVAEYHVFDIPGLVNLESGQTTRLALFSSPVVRVERELVSRGAAMNRTSGPEAQPQAVQSVLILSNAADKGLGVPLPAGRLRVYRDDVGGRILEGEAMLPYLAVGRTERVTLGSAFDVSAERRMIRYEKTGKQSYRVGWEITLRNASSAPRTVALQESLPGQWRIVSSSVKHEKPSSDTARFLMDVPAGSAGVVLKYEAEVEY